MDSMRKDNPRESYLPVEIEASVEYWPHKSIVMFYQILQKNNIKFKIFFISIVSYRKIFILICDLLIYYFLNIFKAGKSIFYVKLKGVKFSFTIRSKQIKSNLEYLCSRLVGIDMFSTFNVNNIVMW